MRAQFFRERLFVFPATKRHGFESHSPRVLDTEMSESADSLDRNNVTGPRPRIAQRVEHRHPCAHERSRFFRWQFVGNYGQCFRRRDHVFCITTIKIDAGDFAINAHSKIAAPALLADEIVSAMPADTDALPLFPIRDTIADRINPSGDFVTRHARILKARP